MCGCVEGRVCRFQCVYIVVYLYIYCLVAHVFNDAYACACMCLSASECACVCVRERVFVCVPAWGGVVFLERNKSKGQMESNQISVALCSLSSRCLWSDPSSGTYVSLSSFPVAPCPFSGLH